MDAVEGADQLHTLEVGAVEFREHSLKLGAEEHTHDRRLNHIAEVMSQGDLVTA